MRWATRQHRRADDGAAQARDHISRRFAGDEACGYGFLGPGLPAEIRFVDGEAEVDRGGGDQNFRGVHADLHSVLAHRLVHDSTHEHEGAKARDARNRDPENLPLFHVLRPKRVTAAPIAQVQKTMSEKYL